MKSIPNQFLSSHRFRRGFQSIKRMIAIMEQVCGRLVPRKGLAKLLGCPLRGRMSSDGDVCDASPIVGGRDRFTTLS